MPLTLLQYRMTGRFCWRAYSPPTALTAGLRASTATEVWTAHSIRRQTTMLMLLQYRTMEGLWWAAQPPASAAISAPGLHGSTTTEVSKIGRASCRERV